MRKRHINPFTATLFFIKRGGHCFNNNKTKYIINILCYRPIIVYCIIEYLSENIL